MYKYLEIESHFEGKLKIAYLNLPDTFNSLNQSLLKELQHFIHACKEEQNLRCIGISGRGPAFCAGQNLKEALAIEGSIKEDLIIQKMVIENYNPLVEAICNINKPVIALVNGPAVGAGAMLALICDVALATESAYFSMAFNNIGLIPDTGGTYFLPKLLGRQTANYLTFTGKKLPAKEAKQMGLIADVFPDDRFKENAMEILFQLSNAATKAIGLTKKAFEKSYQHNLEQQLDLEGIYQQEAAETQDFIEGISAFVEKRIPLFKGK